MEFTGYAIFKPDDAYRKLDSSTVYFTKQRRGSNCDQSFKYRPAMITTICVMFPIPRGVQLNPLPISLSEFSVLEIHKWEIYQKVAVY